MGTSFCSVEGELTGIFGTQFDTLQCGDILGVSKNNDQNHTNKEILGFSWLWLLNFPTD